MIRACLFSCFLAVSVCASAQRVKPLPQCTTLEDTVKYMRYRFIDGKSRFVGKKASVLFGAIDEVLPIKCAAPFNTSPFVDPNRKSYIIGIRLWYKDEWALSEDFDRDVVFFYLIVDFENKYVNSDYWSKLAEDDPDYLYHLRDFIVKDIDLRLVVPAKLKAKMNGEE